MELFPPRRFEALATRRLLPTTAVRGGPCVRLIRQRPTKPKRHGGSAELRATKSREMGTSADALSLSASETRTPFVQQRDGEKTAG